jgi:hypothetical protein
MVVHVRGTPASGKTTLAQLLEVFLKNQGKRTLLISAWCPPPGVIPEQYLADRCRAAGMVVESGDIRNLDVTFIIDEAQLSYSFPSELWYGLIKTQTGRYSGPQICLFASYGSPASGSTTYPISVTPPNLGPIHRVSLLPFQGGPGLFYTRTEFEDVIRRQRDVRNGLVHYDDNAVDYVYRLSCGHPGMVHSLLSFFKLVSLLKALLGTPVTYFSAVLPTSSSNRPCPYYFSA